MSPTEGREPTYVLLPRSASGELTSDARRLADQVSPHGFGLEAAHERALTDRETGIVEELRRLLPKNVVLPENNPFVVLKIGGEDDASMAMIAGCACRCGSEGSCSGSGSGH